MIDTPVTVRFFKKLELYLELKRQDKRVRKSKSERGRNIWCMEKAFLLWAIKGHWHLGTPLNPQYVSARLVENGFKQEEVNHAQQVVQNLVFKKYAEYSPDVNYGLDAIKVTDQGFLMGEVIEDAKTWREYIYILFSMAVWIVVVWGFLEVMSKIIEILKNIF